MKFAIITQGTGMPLGLASTAFVGAFAEGLYENGIDCTVVDLARDASAWKPEMLAIHSPALAPLLGLVAPRIADLFTAIRRGVFDMSPGGSSFVPHDFPDWFLESTLQGALCSIAGNDPDLTVMMYPRSYEWLRRVVRICDRRGWKTVVFATEELSDAQIDPRTRDEYVKWTVTYADALWAVSSYLSTAWERRGIPAERTVVMPTVVRRSSFDRPPVEPPGTSHAVYIGNLVHREVDYLLEISNAVVQVNPEFHLTIYGDATDARREELLAGIEQSGLSGTVVIKAPVAPNEVPAVLEEADILLLPRARGEFSEAGFPNKVGEYLASGRPAVLTDVGDIGTYLVNGVHVLTVPPDDCAAFSSGVIDLLDDPGLQRRLGAAGKSAFERMASSDRVASAVAEFTSDLPASPSSLVGGASTQGVLSAALQLLEGYVPRFKRLVVKVLRALKLKQPAPKL